MDKLLRLYSESRHESEHNDSSSDEILEKLKKLCEQKFAYKTILLRLMNVINEKTSSDVACLHVKWGGDYILYSINIDEFHLFYSIVQENIEWVKLMQSDGLKDSLSSNTIFGFNEELINTIREIKYKRFTRRQLSIIDKLKFNDANFQIFQYFLIDGIFKFNTLDEVINVLKAFVPIMWLKLDFFGNFLDKHVLHASELFETICLKAFEGEMLRFEFHNLTEFRFDNLLFAELMGIFEGTGCYMKQIKLIILNDSFFIDIDELAILMKLINLKCYNLELLEISVYGDSDGFTRNNLIKKFKFLHNLEFDVNIFAMNKKQDTSQELEFVLMEKNDVYYEIKLTKEWMIQSLTESHIKEILSRPLRTLTLLTNYRKIPNWRFIRYINFESNIIPLSILQILRIYKKPNETRQSCIGELFTALYYINNQLALDTLRIEEYTFEEFHVPINNDIKVGRLCLDKCKFGDNADINNALKIFKKTEILQLRETQISFLLYRYFSYLRQITFFYCDYLNDDKLVEIYDSCPRVKVNFQKKKTR